MPKPLQLVAAVHAVYLIFTGVWPIVHMRSFLAVTGPKRDLWLVKTVGAMVMVVGATIGLAAWSAAINSPVLVLAIGSAAALAAVDVVYVLNRTISRIYLIDAGVEALFIVAWLVFWNGWGL